jgi:PAS domain S-box-containing protein
MDEFYAPLEIVRDLMLAGGMLSLCLFILITFKISSAITSPLKALEAKFNHGATGDFSIRMQHDAKDEIGQLADYFNTFMQQLEVYHTNLNREIQERTQAESALRASEEMFSKAFRSSPHGIIISALDDRQVINVNDSFVAMSGYPRSTLIGRALDEIGLFPADGMEALLWQKLTAERRLPKMTIRFVTATQEQRSGSLSAELIELWGRSCVLANIEDVTEAERLEREVMNISEKERLNIGRDLHDDLGPHLIGIEVLVKVLQGKLRDQGWTEDELAGKIRSLTKEAIAKTRALARGLCPVTIDSQGLKNSLEELVHNATTLFHIDCQLDCNCPVEFPDNAIATHLYYILHEAVHNAIKHGQARQVTIRIRQHDGRYRLLVDDDGVGIDIHRRPPADGAGMGLRIMGYRAKKIGARLEVGTHASGGTRIQIDFYEAAKTELPQADLVMPALIQAVGAQPPQRTRPVEG